MSYSSLNFTIKVDEMDSNVKWATFTWENVYYEISPIIDSEGNVDNTATKQECIDYLEYKKGWGDTV